MTGGPVAHRSVDRYARTHPGAEPLTRTQFLATLHASNNDQTWGVWMIIALSVIFAAVALINTAAMAISERRGELATIRLLGGTSGQAIRMVAMELIPIMLVALIAGSAMAAFAIMGVPDGARGVPLVVPIAVAGGLIAGTAALGLAAGALMARVALRSSPAAAMRLQD